MTDTIRKIKILTIAPGRFPVAEEIEDTLEILQEKVGGLIQAVYPFDDDVALICNDEGKMINLPFNRALMINGFISDLLVGTFFICGAKVDEENFSSLTEEQIERYSKMFQKPEILTDKFLKAILEGQGYSQKGSFSTSEEEIHIFAVDFEFDARVAEPEE